MKIKMKAKLILSLLFLPLFSEAKVIKDYFYLILECPESAQKYVDGRILNPPYKEKFFVGRERAFEVRTQEGNVYIGTIIPLHPGDRLGKTFGYYLCITEELLKEAGEDTAFVGKREDGKEVVRIKLKKVKSPSLEK